MREVLGFIEQKKLVYEKLPLFVYLENERDPQQKLQFMRHAAFFIMSFSDLNKYALRAEPASDRWQQIVNDHTKQDDHHWAWYLQDFERLGWNDNRDVISTMRWLWSDRLNANRMLTGELWGLCSAASGLDRLVLVEAIEATGEVLFSRLAQRAEQYTRESGLKSLVYFGDHHFAVEQGHSSGSESADAGLGMLELSPAERDRLAGLVDRVFALFTAWVSQLHDVAVADREAWA